MWKSSIVFLLVGLGIGWSQLSNAYCDTLSRAQIWTPDTVVEYRLQGAWAGNSFQAHGHSGLAGVARLHNTINYRMLESFAPRCGWTTDTLVFREAIGNAAFSLVRQPSLSRIMVNRLFTLADYNKPYWVRFAQDTAAQSITADQVILQPDSLDPPRFRRWMIHGWREPDTVRQGNTMYITSYNPISATVVTMDSAGAVAQLLQSLVASEEDRQNPAIRLHLQILRVDYAPNNPGQSVALGQRPRINSKAKSGRENSVNRGLDVRGRRIYSGTRTVTLPH